MLKPTRVDWREGISQIVECVGVEMWRYGGSTLSRCGDVVDPHF